MMDSKKALTYFSLFTSTGTLLCCALPALLVSIGLGAVMAGLASNIPGLVWISENKVSVFLVAGILLTVNGVILWLNRNSPCPIDPALREACLSGRKISRNIYFFSLLIFSTGFFFAYVAPNLIT